MIRACAGPLALRAGTVRLGNVLALMTARDETARFFVFRQTAT